MPAFGWIVVLYLLTPRGELVRAYTAAQAADPHTCSLAAELMAQRWHELRPRDRVFYGCERVENA